MDFGSAAMLVAVIFAAVEVVKRVWATQPAWATPLISIIIGIGATLLLADTAWANQQVIGDKPLDSLNNSSLIVVGFMAGLLPVALNEGLRTVKNIGQNNPDDSVR